MRLCALLLLPFLQRRSLFALGQSQVLFAQIPEPRNLRTVPATWRAATHIESAVFLRREGAGTVLHLAVRVAHIGGTLGIYICNLIESLIGPDRLATSLI